MQRAPAISAINEDLAAILPCLPATPTVVFDCVHAHQPELRRPLLDGVTFTAATGEITALVCAAWPTLHHCARALLGTLELSAGSILLKGAALGSVPIDRMRGAIGWVPSLTDLQGTILERLRAACPAAGQMEVERAASLACVHDAIVRMTRGYESPLAHPSLSPGTRQRIEIAAAVLERKPVILIDEPGPELADDERAALLIAVERLRGDHTVVLLARSIAGTRIANSIVVLEDGRVFEEGPPEALLDWGDRYAQLVRAPGGLL
ncbi:ATP-binding cassette domain-containing protein [Sphingomonas sp. DT-207]|uniref:ATP-binding cassette domain-containing protein n=1 Tax=Sphingomonas sp. DT-207 TaxID=3396167 RepID=UPI003F198884